MTVVLIRYHRELSIPQRRHNFSGSHDALVGEFPWLLYVEYHVTQAHGASAWCGSSCVAHVPESTTLGWLSVLPHQLMCGQGTEHVLVSLPPKLWSHTALHTQQHSYLLL